MTIQNTDIKIMASERLSDNDDGGGRMSAVEVADGVVNNLFPDISRLSRTYGRVELRKLYAAVRTANREIFYGSHTIIADAPDDPNVSNVLFTTQSYTDERLDAQNKIESYVVQGPESMYVLLGDQLQGQRMVRLYSRIDAKLPEVGQVYLLSEEDGNGNAIGEQQYVRVDTVEHSIQEFEDDRGVFKRRVYTLEIGAPLRRTFKGPATAQRKSAHNSPTLFRSTQVADASKYYGVVPLEEPVTAGDLSIKASGIFGQLVPSATVESPVVDVQAGVERANLQAAGPQTSWTVPSGSGSVGRALLPGSITLRGSSSNYTYTDDSNGNLLKSNGAVVGEIDYDNGTYSGVSAGGWSIFTLSATPAAAIYDTAHTYATKITLANRGYNYVQTLRPIPQPGTLFVDYLSQGNWYRMQDNGKGELVDEYGGSGTIDYITGSVVATLGALPDVGSQVIFTWATPVHYEQRLADPGTKLPHFALTVGDQEFLPGSLQLSWDVAGTPKTATDDGAGNLTGDASGRVIAGLGQIGFTPNVLPDSSAQLTINYQRGAIQQALISDYAINGNNAEFTLPINEAVKPGTFAATITLSWQRDSKVFWPFSGYKYDTSTGSYTITISDNGDGTLNNGGLIDYLSGQVSIPVNSVVEEGKNLNTSETTTTIAGSIIARWQKDSVLPTDVTETLALPDVEFELTPTTRRHTVPGSVEFIWDGKRVVDREGKLYSALDNNTGAGTEIGTYEYDTGIARMHSYQGGGTNSVTVKSLLTKIGEWLAEGIYFRTPGAPLRPASLYFRATRPDGTLMTATPNAQGKIDTPDMQGSINYETGVTDIQFGRWVQETTLTAEQRAEPWYDAANIQADGSIWVPDYVMPGTMKFNAVVLSMMPLDASILGLDPVRLPVDGRVPIIRSGDVLVIHSTETQALPDALSAGQQISLSRDQLYSCVLRDAEGTAVPEAQFSVNRATGVVTMADPLDLTGLVQPLQATHRVEDMVLANEVQINGQIALVGAVSRDYNPASTWVSSALVMGDLGARVHHLFSQKTWNSSWADQRSGSPTTAQYNDRLYPIQVNNKNAIRERWALIFTSSTTFNVVGESTGVIAAGNTGADCAPVNPETTEPYFTIYAAGWGAGWATNNVLRFNTDAAHYPVWMARTTLNGAAVEQSDEARIETRGDAS